MPKASAKVGRARMPSRAFSSAVSARRLPLSQSLPIAPGDYPSTGGPPGAGSSCAPAHVDGGAYTRLEMARGRLTKSLVRTAAHAPGLKRVPVAKLLAAAEVAVLARDHVQRLTPDERR